jgi:glycosyltransferase involved in cell wall biosynthesis
LFHERSEFSWIAFPNNKKLHDDYLKNILPRIKVMAVMTKKLNEYYNQFLSKQTALIHLPMTVDLSRFSEKQAEASLSSPYIGYCGSMNNSKDGVDILIQAFIEIMDQFPDLHLYLAGAKDPREDYSAQVKLIEKNNAQSRITYLGQLSREEIPAFLSNASILALARPNSQQSEGGFPTKLGEYLASGRPVCVTDIGEISDYLVNDKSAFFAEPGSFISFSQAITKALSAADIEKVGKEGQKIAFQIFNKDIQSKRLYDFLVSNK